MKTNIKYLLIVFLCLIVTEDVKCQIEHEQLWSLDGQNKVTLNITDKVSLPVKDHFEMSGQKVDLILEWSVNENFQFDAQYVVRWPMLRTIPDNTHASLERKLDDFILPTIDGQDLHSEKVEAITLYGSVLIKSNFNANTIKLNRRIFTSVLNPVVIEEIELINNYTKGIDVNVPQWEKLDTTSAKNGVSGKYIIHQFVTGSGNVHLYPGESLKYSIIRAARKIDDAPYFGNSMAEWGARKSFLNQLSSHLVLETPNKVLNTLFEYSKIRATESVFSTRGGLMHGPGGYGKYLAAIWANDQAEYMNPLFPFLGNYIANESAINSFRHFANYMNPGYNPIPSSIIAEGRDLWNGAGDRGDMAMIAYGAARYVLATGDIDQARELMPLITWCLEYLERQKLPNGLIASDSDELEGRFPAGDANLATISLYYDALLSANYLAVELGEPQLATAFKNKAQAARNAIKDNLEATVEGFKTYKYFKENKKLRSWIALPLTVGIYDRAKGTIDALFSPKLWTFEGLLTQSGTETVWDRSTLYALKGIFQAGGKERALEKLKIFSNTRLLGYHVPYVIESTSEQNRSQLSAESGLYLRIFTEGLFGIRPTGLNSFNCSPKLPEEWDNMELKNIHAFGRTWNIKIERIGSDKTKVLITDYSGNSIYDNTLGENQTHAIKF